MNQAVAYKHMEVLSELDKHPNTLNQTLLTNVEEILTLENYWREIERNSNEELREVAKNEIIELQKLMISRRILTSDLLQVHTLSELKETVVETKEIDNKKETKVVSITTGKEVKSELHDVYDVETKKPVEQPVHTAEEKTIETTAVAETTVESNVVTTESIEPISMEDLRAKVTELVKNNTSDDALNLAKSYLMVGNYIPKPGKQVHNWKEKEINGWFKDLCERANDADTKIQVKPEPTPEELQAIEEEKEKIRIHKTYYGNTSPNMFEFSKRKLIDADEEAAMIDLATTLLKLKEENKTKEIEVLLNLFFLDAAVHPKGRGYNSLQKYNWWNAVQAANAPLPNNIEYIKNAVVGKKIDNPQSLFEEGKRLIEEDKVDESTALNWFKETVKDNSIKQIAADFSIESNVITWFKNMFGQFFRKDASKETKEVTEEMEAKRLAEIIRILQEADVEKDNITDIVKQAKAYSANNKLPFNLSGAFKEIITLCETHNPALFQKHNNATKDVIKEKNLNPNDSKIKVVSNNEFDIKNWKDTMSIVSYFDTPRLRAHVNEIPTAEEAIEFINKVIAEGRAGTYFSGFDTDKIVAWVKEARKESIKETIEEAVVVTEPNTEDITIPEEIDTEEVTTTEETVIPEESTTVTEEPKVEENTETIPVEETPKITQDVEPSATDVATDESNTTETIEVEEIKDESDNNTFDLENLKSATSRKDFENAIISLMVEHEDKKALRSAIMDTLKKSPRGNLGKYSKNISKNAEGDIHKMLNKIEDNISKLEV